ncbi:uncharacterized protein LOC120339014 isoform X1 [Styela clava]
MDTVLMDSGLGFSIKMDKIEQFVNKEIKDNPVVVFSKSWCGYCGMAKTAFKDIGVKPKVIELDKIDDGAKIQQYLAKKTGGNTVPRVFVHGKFIGGGSETRSMAKSGKLLELVNKGA